MKTKTLTRASPEFRGSSFHPSTFRLPALCVDTERVDDAMPMGTNLRGHLRHNESMARHVSWCAGGSVERAYQPADLPDLQEFLRNVPATEPIRFVGLGSNLLVRDGGLQGTVVFTHWALRQLRLEADGNEIYVEAGLPSPKAARFAALHGLAGAEFLAGIPGTVGGALAMNAGCYGGETWEIVVRVCTVDRRGELHERTPAQYRIGYRDVRLKDEAGRQKAEEIHPSSLILDPYEEWFVAATFRLARGDGAVSRRKIKELLTQRIATQPVNEPNAGSVFRNPAGDFAARLIEACGLKGHAIGGAVISPKHANFIVNRGDARAADIEALIDLAQRAVKAKFDIELEREVSIIGEALGERGEA
jgi:UDP-N-acetylmuramate dehydrogenase